MKRCMVRPQFFIQLIGLLSNAALNSLKYKQELALVREQNIDITHFEEDLMPLNRPLPRTTTQLRLTLAKLLMKLIRPSNAWKRLRNSDHLKTNSASLITNWKMFLSKNQRKKIQP